jgi:ketosteroid isomerase-like protein
LRIGKTGFEMKKALLSLFILIFSASTHASVGEFDANEFASDYFKAWIATQSPEAKKSDVKYYLKFLKDDVGHQHLPYDPESNREPDGKKKILEGMLYYLGAHTKYSAKLLSVEVGYNVVAIKYSTHSKGKHPQTGQLSEQYYDTVEVLELEDGKVAVIRKYSE